MPQMQAFPADPKPSEWGPTKLTEEEVSRIKAQVEPQGDKPAKKSGELSLDDLPDDGPSGDVEVVAKPTKAGNCCCCGKTLLNNYRYQARPDYIPHRCFKPTAKPDAELVCTMCAAAIAKIVPISLQGRPKTTPVKRAPLKFVGRKPTDHSPQPTPLPALCAPREHQLETPKDKALQSREPYHECVLCGQRKSHTGRCMTCTLKAGTIRELQAEARSRQFLSSPPTPSMLFLRDIEKPKWKNGRLQGQFS